MKNILAIITIVSSIMLIIAILLQNQGSGSVSYTHLEIEKYMTTQICTECDGKRLKPEVLAITIKDNSIADITELTVEDALDYFSSLKLVDQEAKIANQILKEINARLQFLNDVGLSYLSLNRAANTLAGGEAQRIRLATQIGSSLMGVLYILDEPSIAVSYTHLRKICNI